jgi:acid phosphatase family membrane protein YuiD
MIAIKFFLAILFSTFIPQIIKIVRSKVKKENENFLELLAETGGMPSSHASLMTSVTTMIFLLDGFGMLFFLSATLTMIIIRDAVGVRFAVGEQARAINSIMDAYDKNSIAKNNLTTKTSAKKSKKISADISASNKTAALERVKAVNGHRVSEVAVGAILGIAISLIIFFLF